MKRTIKYFLILAISIGLGYSDSLEETIESMAQTNAQGYLGPMVTALGMGINSGTYHNAKPHSFLGFDFKLGLSTTSIPEVGKTFEFMLPDANVDIEINIDGNPTTLSINPNNIYATERISSTIFGDAISNSILVDNIKLEDAIVAQLALDMGENYTKDEIMDIFGDEISEAVNNSNIPDIATPKGLDFPLVPMTVPQASIGLPMDIELTFRGAPEIQLGDMGKFKFSGIGGKIGLNQFIPIPNIVLPRIALGYYGTNLAVGDIVKMKNSILTFQVSKSIPFLTVYGGFGIESSSVDVDYIYLDPNPDALVSEVPVQFSFDGENKFRTTIGGRLKLAFLTINADYNIGEFNTYALGLGLTLR